MADDMHIHHIYHAACAVLKKLGETDLPREALRLVEPVVTIELLIRTSPPWIHLQTKAHHHSTCMRARAGHRAKTTPPSNARARHGGNGGEAHEIWPFDVGLSLTERSPTWQGPTATADANPRTPLA